MTGPLLIATGLAAADGALPAAAAVAVAVTFLHQEPAAGVVVVELGGERRRGPTMLASPAARRLEEELGRAGRSAAARGRVCWHSPARDEDPAVALAAVEAAASSCATVAVVPPESWRTVIEAPGLEVSGGLLRAELPAQRRLAALAVTELHQAGARARVLGAAPGAVAARRALAGLDPGGRMGARSRRLARGLLGSREWR